MIKSLLWGASALALLSSPVTAQQITGSGGGGGANPPTAACNSGQYVSGLNGSSAPTCGTPPIGQEQLFSPALASADGGTGAVAYNWLLPSTTVGRIRYQCIGNGGAGGSGGIGATTVVRTGGAGGGAGQKTFIHEFAVADLVAAYPGLTSLYFNFGALGAPGPAETGTSVNGAAGGTSSSIVIKANSTSGTTIDSILPGAPGGGGYATNTAATGGTSGGGFGATGASSLAAGNQAGQPTNVNYGPSAAGAGGGLSASNQEYAGGAAGITFDNPYSSRGAAGLTEGSAGAVTNPLYGLSLIPGIGGAGAGSSGSATVNGGTGGNGGGYGAPGGGGGAGTNGAASGAGGNPTWGACAAEYLPY